MKNLLNIAAGFVILATVFGCKNTPTQSQSMPAATVQSSEDSLYKSVMALHDEAMPKMGTLMGLQKKAQHQIDSLRTLGKPALQPIIQKLEKLNLQLANAEKGMNDWMAQFDPDPAMPTTEERASYFASQQEKAKTMRDAIFTVLDSAKVILK